MLLTPGFPAPRQQHVVVVDGVVIRTDFDWFDGRVVGEFDGRVKYDAALDPDRTALWREKRREDLIRQSGAVVARWAWPDVEHPERMLRIIRRAFGVAGVPGR